MLYCASLLSVYAPEEVKLPPTKIVFSGPGIITDAGVFKPSPRAKNVYPSYPQMFCTATPPYEETNALKNVFPYASVTAGKPGELVMSVSKLLTTIRSTASTFYYWEFVPSGSVYRLPRSRLTGEDRLIVPSSSLTEMHELLLGKDYCETDGHVR